MDPKKIRNFRVEAGFGGDLERFLLKQLGPQEAAGIAYALEHGHVSVDGTMERSRKRLLRTGESIVIDLGPRALICEEKQILFIYRDEQLLAVCKPAGLPSIPGKNRRPDAESLVREQLAGGAQSPILLHRLDTDTSGLLLFALNGVANLELANQFANREVQKTYLALVEGEFPETLEVRNRLFARSGERTLAHRKGKPAETDFRRLAHCNGVSLVEASPHTGRTHQIRVHLADCGYPILGDTYYGGSRYLELCGRPREIRRQQLHAWRLQLVHPGTWQPMTLTAAPPMDFSSHMRAAGLRLP